MVRLNRCRRRRLIIATDCRLARVGPTTPNQLAAVTVHDLMVTSILARIESRSYFPDASVDPTDAR
jgi:hypothetical protein